MEDYNPIRSVDGFPITAPSSYKWGLMDVSASEAGRVESTKMMKMLLGQCVKLELAWNYVRPDVAKQVLSAFNREYFKVVYLDPLMNSYVEKEFYAGDRGATSYNTTLGLWTISLNIIERKAKQYNWLTKEWNDTIKESSTANVLQHID